MLDFIAWLVSLLGAGVLGYALGIRDGWRWWKEKRP